jgi:hypothetical protein
MRNRPSEEMQSMWPKLRPGNHALTSQATPRYNCLAFAVKDERHWWEAGQHGGAYDWPANTPDTLDGWVAIFTREGYRLTTNREVEAGFEKVAIYVSSTDRDDRHVAISDGKSWKSKLGKYQDIQHDSLDLLEGNEQCEYGAVEKILRRSIMAGRKNRKS